MAGRKTKIVGAATVATVAGLAGLAVARRRGSEPSEPSVWHVRPGQDGWLVGRDGGPESRHGTKKDAISAGRKLASERAPSVLVLHYADGGEQRRLTYEAG
ncbi:MAG TPA: DUF2188 domain-containing protein [Longimicrobiales bacterium]|nr:DUF2188 domain-containing protein [Longimicrobiales bacterium]